ncbi:hypothetical protein ACS0TY_018117 [Phlomoides rotata]
MMKQCADTEGTTLLDKTITNARATKEKDQTSGTKTISTTRKRLYKIGIYQVLDSRRRDSSRDDTEFPIK